MYYVLLTFKYVRLKPISIISNLNMHLQGILRIIYAFYMGLSRAEAPYVSIPLHAVIKLNPSAFSCDVEVKL